MEEAPADTLTQMSAPVDSIEDVIGRKASLERHRGRHRTLCVKMNGSLDVIGLGGEILAAALLQVSSAAPRTGRRCLRELEQYSEVLIMRIMIVFPKFGIVDCDQIVFVAKELAQCVRYLADNGMLPRMVQLRKLVHYFLIEEQVDDGDDEEGEKENSADCINAFFRPFVFVQTPESIKELVAGGWHHQHQQQRRAYPSPSKRVPFRQGYTQGSRHLFELAHQGGTRHARGVQRLRCGDD